MIFLTISFWGRVDGTYIFQIEIKQKCSAKTIIIYIVGFLDSRLESSVNNIIAKRGLRGLQTVEGRGDPDNYCNV